MKEAKFDFYCPKFIIKQGTCTIFSCQALIGSKIIGGWGLNNPPPDQLRSDFSGLNNAQKVSKIFFYRKKLLFYVYYTSWVNFSPTILSAGHQSSFFFIIFNIVWFPLSVLYHKVPVKHWPSPSLFLK